MTTVPKTLTLDKFFKKYGVSQKEIAKRSAISHVLMRQHVTGKKAPSAARIKQIEKAIRLLGKELSKVKLTGA